MPGRAPASEVGVERHAPDRVQQEVVSRARMAHEAHAERIDAVAVLEVEPVRELARPCRDRLQAVVAKCHFGTSCPILKPEMLEPCRPMVLACGTERMKITVTDILPVFEADTQFERALGRPHEVLLLDIEQSQERHQRGYRGLAHAHGANFIGLDQ